jgi:hypothetical protein
MRLVDTEHVHRASVQLVLLLCEVKGNLLGLIRWCERTKYVAIADNVLREEDYELWTFGTARS